MLQRLVAPVVLTLVAPLALAGAGWRPGTGRR